MNTTKNVILGSFGVLGLAVFLKILGIEEILDILIDICICIASFFLIVTDIFRIVFS